ncbi:hypothetical protein K474DRAFT_1712207 [Panus rudis PR-1116 ss-1]|nr:hypothetical protein K474DRAFT_1712207 [Panus rudis PR-1116 ss-1]
MDDSDDYNFSDDIEIDDATLAALEAVENNYETQRATASTSAFGVAVPPPKKQKTAHNWGIGNTNVNNGSLKRHRTDEEEFPDISVSGAGSYGVANQQTHPNRPSAPTRGRTPTRATGVGMGHPSASTSRNSTFRANSNPPVAGPSRPTPAPPMSRSASGHYDLNQVNRRTSSSHYSANQRRTPTPAPEPAPPQHPPPQQRYQAGRGQIPVQRPQQARYQAPPQFQSQAQPTQPPQRTQAYGTQTQRGRLTAEQKLKMELDILRAQVEQLQQQHEETQQKLKEAEDKKLAQLGEVSILRHKLQQIGETHTNEIEKMRAQKEAAEAQYLLREKELKAAMEAMRTQFTIKQNELEVGLRKTPWSTRIKRIDRQALGPGISVPSPIRQWNVGSSQAGPSALAETPRRPRIAASQGGSPTRSQQRLVKKISFANDGGKKSMPSLPGFENAFESTPVKVKAKGKGKQGDLDAMREQDFFAPEPLPPSPPRSPPRARQLRRSQSVESMDVAMRDMPPPTQIPSQMPSTPKRRGTVQSQVQVHVEDVDMDAPAKDEGPIPVDDSMDIEPPDWREEAHNIIMSHSIPIGDSTLMTMQRLLHHLPSETSLNIYESYISHSTRLLEMLGAATRFMDTISVLHDIASALFNMAHILSIIGSLPPLIALLNLLRVLSYSIPSFSTLLLTPPDDANSDTASLLMSVINDAIVDYTNPEREGYNKDLAVPLVLEIVDLLETLCWSVPDRLTTQFTHFLRNHEVQMVLLSPKQPSEVLRRAVQSFTFIISHDRLAKHFLIMPNRYNPERPSKTRPQVEQLATYLYDSEYDVPECLPLREDILRLITTLAIADLESLDALIHSHTLIPAIVYFLTTLCNSFWEDEVDILGNIPCTSPILPIINRATSLLYYIVKTPSPKFDLRSKLLNMLASPFTGVTHMFIVSIGRLAHAEPPIWLNEEGQAQLDHTCELARGLLDAVVEGPEIDAIWMAFHRESEASMQTDEA